MKWPQVVMICWLTFLIAIPLLKHGEPKDFARYNIWASLPDAILILVVLSYGGFWR